MLRRSAILQVATTIVRAPILAAASAVVEDVLVRNALLLGARFSLLALEYRLRARLIGSRKRG